MQSGEAFSKEDVKWQSPFENSSLAFLKRSWSRLRGAVLPSQCQHQERAARWHRMLHRTARQSASGLWDIH